MGLVLSRVQRKCYLSGKGVKITEYGKPDKGPVIILADLEKLPLSVVNDEEIDS